MEMLAVGSAVLDAGMEIARGSRRSAAVVHSCAKPQHAMVCANLHQRWPSLTSASHQRAQLRATLRLRCNADPPKKDYDVNEVVERVVHDEEDRAPPEESESPDAPLLEGLDASPFSPADENTDDPFAVDAPLEGQEGMYRESLVTPSKAEGAAASSSLHEDPNSLGISEQSALPAADPLKSGSGGRDWRVYSSSSSSSLLEDILENDRYGGNSVDDYKLRAHVFSESAAFFTDLQKRDSPSVV